MADCSSSSPSQTASGGAELQGMQGRAELSLLLMRAEGQRGDFSGGMSPLSLINAVTAARTTLCLLGPALVAQEHSVRPLPTPRLQTRPLPVTLVERSHRV